MRFLTIFLILLICQYVCTLNSIVGWCTKIKTKKIKICPSRYIEDERKDGGNIFHLIEARRNCDFYNDERIVSICCEGYTKVAGRCKPICKPSCPNSSYCLRPNVCVCEEGYLGKNASTLETQCTPVCDRQCKENSHCIAPNKCACNKGFKGKGSGTCMPICEPSCKQNSHCIAPNKCACNKGFKDNGSGTCLPICEPSCKENSHCIAPNKCACNKGFKDNGSGTCLPICEQSCNANASCIAPNKCASNVLIMPIERFHVPWNFIGIGTILTSLLSIVVYVKCKIGEYPNKVYQV